MTKELSAKEKEIMQDGANYASAATQIVRASETVGDIHPRKDADSAKTLLRVAQANYESGKRTMEELESKYERKPVVSGDDVYNAMELRKNIFAVQSSRLEQRLGGGD